MERHKPRRPYDLLCKGLIVKIKKTINDLITKVERKFFVLNCLYHHYIKSRYKVATSPARQLPQCFYLDVVTPAGGRK